jgi:adenylyl cyclase-associated protein
VKSWIQTLTELQQFVKQYHTTGLVWSGQGTAAAPPPPPGLPPPPPVLPVGDVAPSMDSSLDRSALFKDINKGESVTSSKYEQFFSFLIVIVIVIYLSSK